MLENIVFFRHGKAQEKVSKIEDTKRHLTEEGKELLETEMKGLMLMMPDDPAMQIWASKLDRSRETAEIIKQHIGKEILVFDFINTGNYKDMITSLKACPVNSVLIVGHEPWLGDWSKKMTGCRLPFKKGAGAMFKPDTDFEKFSISWFVQPQGLSNLGLKASR
ncbi:SixA phosphatase family protein [Alkalibacter mobilis]|uniref:SixA phosphatase family protein n=1 Tax=Alkalibacter mobilis TaxID=2787712 RepID=UPI0018A0BCD4|nr:histidine phosphatase family protein [Alkalibacter mobilis]MBF7097757.1 histidine phosphatase family protein [Alkalibacter mobilis]